MTSPSAAILVRDARPDDATAIAELNARLALDTERKRLDPSTLARGVAAALRDPDRLRYWVACLDGYVVGQAAVTREWSDWRNGWVWWFQSVYVRPEHRGRGVFRALFQQIRDAARAEPDVIGLRLYVEQDNLHAQATYRALGLTPGGYHVYEQLWTERLTPHSG